MQVLSKSADLEAGCSVRLLLAYLHVSHVRRQLFSYPALMTNVCLLSLYTPLIKCKCKIYFLSLRENLTMAFTKGIQYVMVTKGFLLARIIITFINKYVFRLCICKITFFQLLSTCSRF